MIQITIVIGEVGMQPVEIVRRYFEVFSAGNIDAVLDLLDEKVVWNVAGVPNVPTVGLLRGKEKVRLWMENFPTKFQPLDFTIDRYFVNESDVLVTGRFRHRVLVTDRVVGSDLIIRFTVKDDLICRYQILEDSAILSQAFDIDFPWRSYKQRINGRLYAYDDTQEGFPLIFAHGLFVNRSFFSDQVNFLSNNHRCINIDLPGHGESDTPDRAWSLEDVADDMALFIEENHLPPVNFVGHSQGGMIAIRLAAKYPELINKLVLIGASARPEPPERIAFWNTIKKSIFEGDSAVLDGVFKGVQQHAFPAGFVESNPNIASDERKMMSSNSRRGMVLSIDTAVLNRTDTIGLLSAIKAKTLVICGDQDQATPVSLSKEIVEGITDSCLEILPGVGHHAPLEVPTEITKRIEKFIHN
jgi:3-oxoadipate enol-lactonase